MQASLGLSRVLLTQNYRAGQSRSYYQEGIRSFREFWLGRSRHEFDVSVLYDETNTRAAKRREDVERVLAMERLDKARALEEDGLFYAAGKEYRLVLLLEPDNEEARDGYDRMDLETRAHRKLAEAEMSALRGDLERASELVADAELLADQSDEAMERMAVGIEEKRLRAMYDEARAFERDYQYPEAVEAYGRLLDEVEFYEDAITRMVTIEEFIALADECYAGALAAASDEEMAAYLRRIPVFWPEYRDVEERLAEVEARLAAAAEEPGEGAGGPRGSDG